MFSLLFDCRLNIPGLMEELGCRGWAGYQAVAAGEFPFPLSSSSERERSVCSDSLSGVQAHQNYPPVVHVTSNSPEYNKSYCRPSLLFYFLQNYIFFLLSHTTRDNLL